MKRSGFKPRTTRLTRTPWRHRGGPIPRTTTLKARGKKGSRFPHRRRKAYRDWIATLPCLLAGRRGHRCEGDVVCCHVKTRNTGGDDVGNCYPGCTLGAHEEEHRGQQSFQKRWHIDLPEYARQLGERYHEERAA